MADWCAFTGASTEMPSTSGSEASCSRSSSLHLRQHAADQRQPEPAVPASSRSAGRRLPSRAGSTPARVRMMTRRRPPPFAIHRRWRSAGPDRASGTRGRAGCDDHRAPVPPPRRSRRRHRPATTPSPWKMGSPHARPLEHAACQPGRSPRHALKSLRDHGVTKARSTLHEAAHDPGTNRTHAPCRPGQAETAVFRTVPGDPPELKRMSRSEPPITALEERGEQGQRLTANAQLPRHSPTTNSQIPRYRWPASTDVPVGWQLGVGSALEVGS